ncbi:Lantibiotic dehydratase, C terminus [Paenibacillus polysaccharolyticus]|uniref:Lantibiotic dehydratase, C terminus n=1 Tax=Paenibacillus polysaccharolyticus TaxID=582692 RepID=A0A1G5D428_9BACL|nr:lantibiotic dehydratase [Paenibacillus polysaccharolyticus]SCY09435.1 Lantibiotic dehydratase, C terminus [Paenibacillus polysaccharolyticus]
MTLEMTADPTRKQLDRGEWRFFPHVILRSAGFPLHWLQQLSFLKTSALIYEKKQQEAKCKEALKDFKVALRNMPELTNRQRKRLHRQLDLYTWPAGEGSDELLGKIENRRLMETKELFDTLKEISDQINTVFADELRRNRRHLQQIFMEYENLQEATYLSSPNAYETGLHLFINSELDSSRANSQRKKEKMATKYLQRFTSKNETASFYGPSNYGVFTSQPGRLDVRVNGKIQRRIFLAYWAVQSLADKIANDIHVQPYLKPKLSPFLKRENTQLRQVATDKLLRLPNLYQQIIEESNGIKNVSEIAHVLDLPLTECLSRILKLKEKRVLVLEVDFPTSVFETFHELKEWIHQLPNDCASKATWQEIAHEWSDLLNEWNHSSTFEQRRKLLKSLEISFEKHIGVSSRKDQGKHYSDRMIVYEEAHGDVSTCLIGQDLKEQWKAQLTPIFRLLTCRAGIEHQAFTTFAYEQYQKFESKPNFLSFALHMQQCKQDALEYVNKELQAFDHKLVTMLQGIPLDSDKINVTGEEIERFCSQFPSTDLALFSPDVMMAAPDAEAINEGQYQLVLGEVHSGIQVWSVLDSVYPERDQLNAEIYHHLGDRLQALWLEHVGPRAPGKTFRPELSGGITIENLGRSMKSQDEVRAVSELDLVYDDRFYIVESGHKKIMDLETDVEPLNQIFSFPSVKSFSLHMGEHTPRIEINGVVYQRERWKLNSQEILTSASDQDINDGLLIEWAIEFKETYSMPRYVYVRGDREPKPIFVDFENFFTLELLIQLLKKNELVVISEMLPSADDLWFERHDSKYTSEFRFSVIYENLT